MLKESTNQVGYAESRQKVWLATAYVLLLVGVALAWSTYHDYKGTLAEKFVAIESQARLGGVQISGALDGIDLLLQTVIDDELAIPKIPPEIIKQRHLGLLKHFSAIHYLIVVNHDGQVTSAESLDDPDSLPKVRTFNASERDYFTGHRDAKPEDYFRPQVSRPFKTITNRHTITISRAIRSKNGQFLGVALVSISPSYFNSVLQQVLLNPVIDAAAIHNRFGDVIYRLPDAEKYMGKNVGDGEAFQQYLHSDKNLTRYVGIAVTDGIKRVLVFSKVGDTTLDVGVAAQFDHVMAEWRKSFQLKIVFFIVITGLSLFLAREIQRRVLDRKQAEEKIEFLAYHDALTELPNRLLAQDRFRQAMAYADRSKTKLALIYLDLDNFKTINDSLGHLVGDGLIQEVTQRIVGCVRDTDTVSRQGGDEFLVLLSELNDAEALAPVLVKLMDVLTAPALVDGHELSTSASLGIAIYPDDGSDFESLMKKADMAMYRAKEGGRNTYCFFDEQMNVDAVEQLRMRNGLRTALTQHQFVLHYQPQIDIKRGTLIGAEALIRWIHPELGMVPPGRFIQIAEDSGLIIPIGEWVLREACRQAVSWQKAGRGGLVIAVNLSAVQFKRGNIEQSVINALEESGLNPALLELELTESILIHDTENIMGAVRRLKNLGVKLSIDDFGTGYSSLSYLKRLQVNKLKIDQSFVRGLATDPEDAAIVRAIIQMAKSLGLTTIAEGVEDDMVLARLREFDCDEVQGFYFARPMPSEDFSAFHHTPST